MSSILLPRRFYSQPQGTVGIAWDNPLARGVTFASPTLQWLYAKGGGVLIPAAGVTTTVGPQGKAAKFSGSTGVRTSLGTAPVLNAGKPFSVSLRIRTDANSAYSAPMGLRYGASGVVEFIRGSASPYEASVGPRGAAANSVRNFSTSAPTTGVWEHWTITNASGPETTSGYIAYLNGLAASYTTNTSYGSGAATTSYLGWDGFATHFNGAIQDFVVWDRALSAEEADRFYKNPWQIFRVSE